MPMDFNLSAWALRNRSLVIFLMLVLAVAGSFSYSHLGQSEDPPFTFRAMVIKTYWPGATAVQVSRQVTDRIEQAVMETGDYDRVLSFSRAGESTVVYVAKDSIDSDEIPALWYQVRKKVGDVVYRLPPDVQGPMFDDEFGTTYGNIYALTGTDFDYALLKDYADRLQLQLQRVPDVGKVQLLGLQEEKIWIELSNLKLATLGVPLSAVQEALQAQNAVAPSGFLDTPLERVWLRVSGQFETVEQIREFPIRIDGRTLRIGDVAEVRRGFNDPAAPSMRFQGEPAIGLAVSMRSGGDIVRLGEVLDAELERLQRQLPAGMQLHKVSDQPAAVRAGVGEFVQALVEALAIVLLVSFFSLGLRTGLVVALSIPLVLAMTFLAMDYFGIGLHKISLGALVLALGLLVDDAIIAVEMMAIKIEQGFDRLRAASFAWTSTAFPMLTGTLITAAGFLPIATADSATGEYTRSIFQVVTLSLVASWIAAVLFVPLLGDKLLPDLAARRGRERAAHDPYATPFYRRVRATVAFCVRRRWSVIGLTLGVFALSLFLFRFVPQQFFPASGRLELMVDLKMAEGASLQAVEAEVRRMERLLAEQSGIDNYVAYVGAGSPRFYLPLDQQLPVVNFAQFVVLTKSLAERERVRSWLIERLREDFPTLRGRVTRLENGPPVGFPIQLRVSGEHLDELQRIARQLAVKVRENPLVSNVNLDWAEPTKTVRLHIDQDRARALGVSSAQLSRFLQSNFSGEPISHYREDNELIEILLRATAPERLELSRLPDLAVPTASGRSVPLKQIATLEYGFEQGLIWHRDRLPTVTVRADIYGKEQPATVVEQLRPALDELRAGLPDGYLLEVGGTVEESAQGQDSVNAGMPLFVVVVLSLLMLQLRSFSRMALVFLTGPLGIIGVTAALLAFDRPFGFVAMLGTIALSGMIMRNSLILVDQIEQDVAAGVAPGEAIVESAVRRFRPIVLTALASVLAMIPLSGSVFFGPMAVAMMGGLIVATALTLLFLPALYAAWFRVREVR